MRWFQRFAGQKGVGLKQIRKGMWVIAGGKVGILVDIAGSGEATVHLVDELGFTAQSVTLSVAGLRQARWAEIPEPRRPGKEAGAKLGYV